MADERIPPNWREITQLSAFLFAYFYALGFVFLSGIFNVFELDAQEAGFDPARLALAAGAVMVFTALFVFVGYRIASMVFESVLIRVIAVIVGTFLVQLTQGVWPALLLSVTVIGSLALLIGGVLIEREWDTGSRWMVRHRR